MKIYFPLLLALFCLNGFISGVHLPLNDHTGAKLINSKSYGTVKIDKRGDGNVLTFNGNNGPSFMKYFIHENITTSTDSCFKSLSNCHDFIVKFWFKYHTNVSDSRLILRQGPDNNHKKGLNVLILPNDRIQISHDDGKVFRVIETKYKPAEWNFVKLTSANSDFKQEINGVIVKSVEKPSQFNSDGNSPESLIIGFEQIAKGSYVSFDDYKLELPNLLMNNVETINSDGGKKLRYNGRNHIELDFKNKLRLKSNQEELDITFKFPKDSTSGLIWYSEKGAEKSFVYLKESKLYYVYVFKQYEKKASMRTTEEISVPDILPPNTYHRLVIKRQADKLETTQNLTLSINEVVRAKKEIIEGSLPMLIPGGKVFVGGHYNTKIVTEGRIKTQFKGEINKVVVKGNKHADFNLIELMQKDDWKQNIQNRGSVEISINPNDGKQFYGDHTISETPVATTVKEFSGTIRLDPWNFDKFESVELEFRTKEPRGVLFFVGPESGHTDYVCVEFFDSNIYFLFGVDRKNYRVRLNEKSEPVTTGKFHRVYFKRDLMHNFIVKLDNKIIPIPKSAAHQNSFGSYTYIGGFDNPGRLPWYVWSRVGFVGCINYIRINDDKYISPRGLNNQHSSEIQGYEIGSKCLDDVPSCTASKCGAGKCHDRTYPFNSDLNFYCDCSASIRTYKTPIGDIRRNAICERVSDPLISKGTSFYVVDFKSENSQNRMMKTHSDDIAFSFKTRQRSGTLFRTFRTKPNLYFTLELENGYLKLKTNINDLDQTGALTTLLLDRSNLNDDQWHTVYIKRRANVLKMYVDDESNIRETRMEVISRTFNNVFEYILIGSSNFETNDLKFKGSFRNFYWNSYDLLGTRRLVGTYRGTIKTPKPVDPPLPPYPRDPPVQCTMTAGHKFTHVADVVTTDKEVGFFIEFKTRYSGIIWHAYDNLDPNGRYMTLLIIDDRLMLVYKLNEDSKVQIVEDGSRFKCNDNNWHRITIMIHKTLKRITVLPDKDITPIIYYLALNQELRFNKMSFYFGGMPKQVYDIVFTQLRLTYPNWAQKISDYNDYSLTGCLGDFLTSESDFKRNLFSGAKQTYPLNTVDCSGCKDPMKCVPGYCKNGGTCFLTPDTKRVVCKCANTGYTGQFCEKRQPRCPVGYCANGGRCFLSNDQPRCDCSNTGYRGDRCQISYCSASYCYNGGICRIVNGQPTCDCINTKYTGKLCNQPICSINFCQNGGRCIVNSNNKPQCDCFGTGFKGARCEIQICRPNFCLNGGTCIPRNGISTCSCLLGFEGVNCERTVCTRDYCYNGGQCIPYLNTKKCKCPSNYDGTRCEIEKRCPKGYCQNGGRCSMLNGSPVCDCSGINRKGDRCQYLIECPMDYCSNNGVCSIRNNGYYCNCKLTFTGDRCQYKNECPKNFCYNNGICNIVNNNYVCFCEKTGYTGSKCERSNRGILTSYDKNGYAIYNVNPIQTDKNSIAVGFQTYMPTGTIFTIKTVDNKYLALRLKDGKLVLDANGELNYLMNSVNDGSYYVVTMERKDGYVSVRVTGKENESTYFRLGDVVNNYGRAEFQTIYVGVNQQLNDQFKGSIGGFVYDGSYIMKMIESDPNLQVGTIRIVDVPLSIPRPPTQCPMNYCRNNGICQMVKYSPICICEKTGYFGKYCEKQTKGIFPVPGTAGGYMILKLNPPKTTNTDSMSLLLQTLQPDNPVVRFELTNGHYYGIRMIDGKLYLYNSNREVIPINIAGRLDNGNPYLVEFTRENDRIVFQINGQTSGSISIKDLTGTNGMIEHRQIVLGADKQLRKYFKGAIGGFNWNGYKMIKSTGGTSPGVSTKGTVTIVVMPKLNVTVIPTIRPPVVVPEVVIGKLHGGVVWSGAGSIYIPGIGVGGGGIVPAGVGPTIVGAGSATGVLMLTNPLIAGLIMAGLLLLSAMIWACWRCKPGCCPCCAGVAKGAGGAAGLKSRILSPMQAAALGTGAAGASGAAKTGEKSFWSKMKTTVTTPAAAGANSHRDIYESSGNKIESHALLSPNGMGNGYHASSRDDRFNTTHLRGSSNMLDANDYRFGTMGHGSIMRIDTTHHEIDGGAGGPNVFGEEMKVECCVLSENSRYAVTGSEVGPPQVWDMQTGELCKVMDGMEMGATHLHLACGDSVLVGLVATDESRRLKRLQMWDFVSGAQIAMPNDIVCSATAVTHSGNHLILHREHPNSGAPPSILVWDLAANQPIQEIQYDPPAHLYPNHEGVNFLQVAPGDRMVVAGFTGEDDQAHYMVFDTSASYPSGVVVQPLLLSIDAKVGATALIGPEEAITGTKKGELIVWNLRSAKPVRQVLIHATLDGGSSGMTTQLNPHKDAIQCVALSNDGQYLATGSTDRTVNVYTMADERLLHSLEGHADDVLSVVISHDNEIIVSGSWDGSMRVWKLATGDPMCWFTSNIEILQVKLTNDKKAIVALGERMGMRKLIMLQIIRNKSRRTRHTDNTIGSPPVSVSTPISPHANY